MKSCTKDTNRTTNGVGTSTPLKRKANAFSVMMSGKKSKKTDNINTLNRGKQSDFVNCPNCRKHISFLNINIHLDKCVGAIKVDEPTSSSLSAKNASIAPPPYCSETKIIINREAKSNINSLKPTNKQSLSRTSVNSADQNNLVHTGTVENVSSLLERIDDSLNHNCEDSNQPNADSCKANAFNKMMQNSKKVYDRETKKVEKQRFHLSQLDGKFHVEWISGDGIDDLKTVSNIQWSSSVMLHPSEEEQPYLKTEVDNVELHISSSIPSDPPYGHVWTKQKSKLSVPVLKSILQKSIRRRRPLPSVRLAMELADKSFGDLIRRLPIICLEDSTLHQDFPLLCWMMCADSKDFVAPLSLMKKVFRIVFEISSCPWKDMLDDNSVDENPTVQKVASASEKKSFEAKESLMLRSIILRKKYGGMACDIKMCAGFVNLWSKRYRSHNVNVDIATKVFPSMKREICWVEVPVLIHSFDKNTKILDHLLNEQQLPFLKLHDISPSGVDFHCSNIVEFLVKDTAAPIFTKLSKHLSNKSIDSVKEIIQNMMWNYSSGINRRRYFFDRSKDEGTSKAGDTILKEIWDEDVQPLMKKFTDAYLSTRLIQA